MFASDSLNVNLSDSADTQYLYSLQTKATESQNKIIDENKLLQNRTIGEPGAEIKSGSLSEADLVTSSFTALARTPKYVIIFQEFMGIVMSAIGVDTNNPMMWFIIASIMIVLTLLMIGIVFKNVILQ